VGTKIGLYLYNRIEDNFIGYFHEYNNPNSLSHNLVSCVNEDLEGNLWIGTTDGLNKYDEKNQRFIRFNENAGLPNNVITNLLFDDKGSLWITTNKGLTRLDSERFMLRNSEEDTINNRIIRNYGMADDLQNTDFRQNASYKDSDGQIYLGGINGFNVFHPDSIMDNKNIPNVIITEFKLFNKTVTFNSENSPLTKPIELTQRIILNHKQSVFTFGFVALNYNATLKNQYAYKLQGYDKDWNYIGNKHEVTYTSLPAGNYIFRVIASNNDGLWNTQGVTLQLRIIPPFWERWWFRGAIMLWVLFLIYIYYSHRLLKEKKTNKLLENKVAQRTEQLSEKNNLLMIQTKHLNEANSILKVRQQLIEEQSEELKSQRDELKEVNEVKDMLFSVVAHDLKNPFSTVLGLSDLLKLKYNDYSDKQRMEIISSVYNSLKVINDLIISLLEWSRSQMGNLNPQFDIHNLSELLLKNIQLANVNAQVKNIKIINGVHENEFLVKMDVDLINAVIRNLISNAIKFTPIDGIISISCVRNTDKVIVKIRDNGVGITKDILPKLFLKSNFETTYGTNNEKGSGLGLKICQDFVKLHNGEIWVESEEGKGSEFCFSLPV
jgi:signal transduction histidine kinase